MVSRGRAANIKGKVAEREAAEILKKLTGVKYRRVPMSGALRTELPGDLMKMDNRNSVLDNILIEVKHQKVIKLQQWFTEAEEEAQDGGIPFQRCLLMVKIRGKWAFIFNESGIAQLIDKARLNS